MAPPEDAAKAPGHKSATRRALARAARQAELVAAFAGTWFRPPEGPVRVVLGITRRCNLRCSMCRSWEAEAQDELTCREIGELLAEMPALVSLDLTGGEPFMREDIADVFETVLDFAPGLRMLHFTTNGWFASRARKVVEQARRHRPEVEIAPTVSIDGPPELHDAIRGRPGAFERALSTFLRLREIPGVSPNVGTTVTPFNAARAEELGELLASRIPGFDASRWHWNWLQISSHFFDNAAVEIPEVEAPEGLLPRQLARRGLPRSLMDLMESFFILNLEFVRRGEAAGLPCEAMRSTAFISPEGLLYPCHVYDRPIGDVRQGFAKLWRSKKARLVRGEVERLACGGCFTPCEAYPMFAGAPLTTLRVTATRALRLAGETGSRRRTGAVS